jgi:hypothetical protein
MGLKKSGILKKPSIHLTGKIPRIIKRGLLILYDILSAIPRWS